MSIKAYANRDEQNYDLASLVVPHFGVVPAPFDSPMRLLGERYDLEAQHTLAPTSTTRLVWGAGVRIDRFTSRFFFNSDQASPSARATCSPTWNGGPAPGGFSTAA